MFQNIRLREPSESDHGHKMSYLLLAGLGGISGPLVTDGQFKILASGVPGKNGGSSEEPGKLAPVGVSTDWTRSAFRESHRA